MTNKQMSKIIRTLQLIFSFLVLYFFYWAHIYEMLFWNKNFLATIQTDIFNSFLYATFILLIFISEIYLKRYESTSHVVSIKISKSLGIEKTILDDKDLKKNKMSSNKLGMPLIVLGVALLILSVALSELIVAFIGLSLTFWGILFLFIASTQFVPKNILTSSTLSYYANLDRALTDLNYSGKSMSIPPCPTDAYLPINLGGMKDPVTFISAGESISAPSIEELVKKKFIMENPKGLCISPPGLELIRLFEKEMKTKITNLDINNLEGDLASIIIKDLELATGFEFGIKKDQIQIKIVNSVYRDLYSKSYGLKSILFVGCPLVSAVTFILAIATGKNVVILKNVVSPDLKVIEVCCQLV